MPDTDKAIDYLYYLIDLVALVLALTFSLAEAYSAETTQLIYKIPLVILAALFKYIYLMYYAITKFL